MVNAPVTGVDSASSTLRFPSGTVKCVLSGDTIVIRGRATNGPPPERILTFSFVACPRFGRRGQGDDEVSWLYLHKIIDYFDQCIALCI
jgi:hypothetical protein